jgi:NTE family protein
VTRVGLVLGAGGATGHAFHAGVLSALADETGWDPRQADLIVGTSAGSGVAAILRIGLSAGDLAARAMGEPISAEGQRITARLGAPVSGFGNPDPAVPPAGGPRTIAGPAVLANALRRPFSARIGSVAAAFIPPGRRSTTPISAGLRAIHGRGWPEKPVWINAVRLDTAQRVVFGREGSPAADLPDAVAASCAIPGYFEPVEIDGVQYVDGGAHSPTNADVLGDGRAIDLDMVVVSSPMSVARGHVRASADIAARLLFHRYLAGELARLRRRKIPVLTFEPTSEDLGVMGINPMDWKRRPRVVQQVRDSARRRINAKGWTQWIA